ncbi:MAG: hypothetical protein WCK27_25215 [Verrucomicrobiota bacterium]
MRRKHFVIALLVVAVTAGPAWAADTRKVAVPGTDDLSRNIATKATPGAQTTLRDASGRTVGTASTAGTGTTTFRDSSGRTTGSSAVQGSQTVFRDASGRTVWTATKSGSQTTSYRDATGRTQRSASEINGRITFRDGSGRRTSTVEQSRSSATARDASGRTIGTTSTTGVKQPGTAKSPSPSGKAQPR